MNLKVYFMVAQVEMYHHSCHFLCFIQNYHENISPADSTEIVSKNKGHKSM